MKVGFNARLLADPNLRGWNRYTVNLLAELPAVGVTPVLYGDRPIHTSHLARLPHGLFEVHIQRIRPYALWEQLWLPWRCKRDGVSILHAPANFGLPRFCGCPRVLTLHDAIDPNGTLRSRMFHAIARKSADRVITVSGHARDEIVAKWNVDAKKIRVIPEAADPVFFKPVSKEDRSRVLERYRIETPYFFYVGGWEARKNVPFLIDAFEAANLAGVSLVLAGGRDEERSRMKFPDRVQPLGWVDEDDLRVLYSEALAFVYPSKHEGFGLQLCEAMATGCPVFAARATSLPEVLGDGGETFRLDDVSELVELMRRVVGEMNYRDQLVYRARKRSREFSWEATASATVKLYRESCISSRRPL